MKTITTGNFSVANASLRGNSLKEDDSTNTDVEEGRVTATGEANDVEYPEGFKLFIIVLALVLAVFLVALDMVTEMSSAFRAASTNSHTDNRCDGNPENHRRVWRSQGCILVRLSVLHVLRRLPVNV